MAPPRRIAPSRCSACGTTGLEGSRGREEVRTRASRLSLGRCAAVCVVGVDALLVHGGEDPARSHRPLGDAHVLDLETMAWRRWRVRTDPRREGERRRNQPRKRRERVQTDRRPCQVGARRVRVERRLRDRVRRRRRVRPVPRGPVALKRRDRDVGDTDDVRHRVTNPAPRAGHAGAVVADRYWCIVGGGNGRSGGDLGCAVLDLDAMEWCGSGADETNRRPRVRGLRASSTTETSTGSDAPVAVHRGRGHEHVRGGDGGGRRGADRVRGVRREVPRARAGVQIPVQNRFRPSARPTTERGWKGLDGKNGPEGPRLPIRIRRSPRAWPRGGGAGAGHFVLADEEGDGVSSAEASARLRVDALTADNLRPRRENAQLREDARRVVNVQRTMETALEQQKRRCEALENRLGEERERANASLAKVAELEAAADALRARIKSWRWAGRRTGRRRRPRRPTGEGTGS